MLEIVDALVTVWSADHVALRLSLNGSYSGMGSPDNVEMFTYVFDKLSGYGFAYLAILDGCGFEYHDKGRLLTAFDAKTHFKGTLLTNGSYTRDIAEGAIRSGVADFVSFSRAYIANPDLAEHFEHDLLLRPKAPYEVYWDFKKGTEGYIDYPEYMAKQ